MQRTDCRVDMQVAVGVLRVAVKVGLVAACKGWDVEVP